jgi:hypothetical protein
VSYGSTHYCLLPLEAFPCFRIAPASPLCCVLTTSTKPALMTDNLASEWAVRTFFGYFRGGVFCRRAGIRAARTGLAIGDRRLAIEKLVWQLLPMSISNRKSAIPAILGQAMNAEILRRKRGTLELVLQRGWWPQPKRGSLRPPCLSVTSVLKLF